MLTREDIFGRKTVDAIHIDMAGGASAWMMGIEGLPRLHVYDYTSRKHGSYRHWYVDKMKVRDLDAALAVLNGTMTLDQAAREEHLVRKVSLQSQIAEVERELQMREQVYPNLVRTRKMSQERADLYVQHLAAALATLQWLRDNETDVRAYAAAKAEARKKGEAA